MSKDDVAPDEDDLRPEYDPSELKGGVRGKYLERYRAGTNLALLAPEVRAAFPTDEAVNQALRSLIQAHQPAQPGTAADPATGAGASSKSLGPGR